MNPVEFFRRLSMVLAPVLDAGSGGQVIINIAPGGRITNVELRKVVKNPE